MISRLDRLQGRDIYENTALAKLNEVIDAVNELQEMYKSYDKQIGILAEQIAKVQYNNSEKANCQENVQDKFAKQRKWIGKLCKFWDYDITHTSYSVLDDINEYGETLVEQLDNIQAYCWQEGYVLTHEEDLERVITALEQKDM